MFKLPTEHARNELAKLVNTINDGDYLDRIITLATAFQLKDHAALLEANRTFRNSWYAPAGLKDLIAEVADIVLHKARLSGLNDSDLAPFAWSIPIDVLTRHGLHHLRKAA